MKDKKTINPNNDNDKCFQYAITAALNHEQIKSNLQRIAKKKNPFINQYDWNEKNFLSKARDWKKFETNEKSIAVSILFVPHNEEEIKQAYISKYSLQNPSQIILLMIV